jgi:hypothetical protein
VKVFELPPEMSDGVSGCVVDDLELVVDALRSWMDEATSGEGVEITCRDMSAEDLAALPEL